MQVIIIDNGVGISQLLDATVIMLILTILAHLTLGIFVAVNNPRAVSNLLMLSFSVVVAMWGLAILFITIQDDYNLTLFWIRVSHALGIIAPWHVLAITLSLFQEKLFKNKVALITMAFSILFAVLSFTPYFITGIMEPYQENLIIYGFLTYPWILFLLLMTAFAFSQLYKKMKIARSKIRAQLSYFYYGTLATASMIIIVNVLLPFMGVIYIFGIDIRSMGPAFSLIMLGAVSYSIVKYRFMDIRFALRKNLTTVVAAIILACFAVVLIRLLFNENTGFETADSELLIAIVVFLVVIGYPTISRRIDYLIRKLFYKNFVDYHSLLANSVNNLRHILDKELIFETILNDLVKYMNLEYGLYCLKGNDRQYELPGFSGSMADYERIVPDLAVIKLITDYLDTHKRIVLQSDFSKGISQLDEALVSEKMKVLEMEMAIPLMIEDEIEGILFLGLKNSGEPFYREDINLISSLSSQVTSSLVNARLYEEILSIKQYQENILLNMGNGLIAVNEAKIITVFNNEAEYIFGLNAEKVIGQKITPALGADIYDLFWKTINKGAGIKQVEIKHTVGKNTSYLTCNTSIVESPESRAREVIIVFSNVTRIKELEQEKSKSERLVSLGEVAAGIAHEIKNPLVSIKTFADLLPEKYEDHDFRNRFSSVVSHEIIRINDLVGELLNFVKEPVLTLEKVNIKDLIGEVIALLSPQLDANGIMVNLDFQGEDKLIDVDRALIKQALLNICVNAVHAMPEGGILNAGIRTAAGNLTVFIEDSGVGISEVVKEKIFDPFVTSKADGVGIGLSISHKIIAGHGGKIDFSSIEGAGSRFEVVLPLS